MNKDLILIIGTITTTFITALFGTINLFAEKGQILVSVIFFGIMVVGIIIFLLVLFLKKNKRRTQSNCQIQKSLTEHHFFSEMTLYIKREIDKIEIQNPLKKIVITTFLKIKFQVFHDIIKNYVKKCEDILKEGGEIIIDEINDIFLNGIDTYNNKSKEVLIKYRKNIIQGVPECFIKSFDKWHTPHVQITYEGIRGIVNNEIYPNELMKLLAIIELFNIVFKLTIEDALKAKDELNGELEQELNRLINETSK